MFGIFKNDEAVSPIVATLVLIVVAIIGAAAVGTMMGAFSSDVSEQANAGDVAGTSASNVIVAGSTTVQPVSEFLAKAYMGQHAGVKITVQGGGSGAGVTSVGMDVVDIGSSSSWGKYEDGLVKYPNLQAFQIGGSAVVVIANGIEDAAAAAVTAITQADLEAIYDDDAGTQPTWASGLTAVQRDDASGTEETFAEFAIGAKTVDNAEDGTEVTHVKATGNAGVLAAVKDTPNSIGFVDYGYLVNNNDGVEVLALDADNDGTDEVAYIAPAGSLSDLKTAILGELKAMDDSSYVADLCRPLLYITNGAPSTIEKDFINFAMGPTAIQYFNEAGAFSIIEFA